MGVLKRWNGTEWEIIGAPTKSSNSYFTIDSEGILTIAQENSEVNEITEEVNNS